MKPLEVVVETDPDKVIKMLDRYATVAFEQQHGEFRGLSIAIRSAIVVIERQSKMLRETSNRGGMP